MSNKTTDERLGFPPCMVPPRGWVCTREPGHEGPCAAHPVDSDIAAEQIESFKACLTLANKAYAKLCRETASARHPQSGVDSQPTVPASKDVILALIDKLISANITASRTAGGPMGGISRTAAIEARNDLVTALFTSSPRETTPERREYHANGTYWSGVPTVTMPCDFCQQGIEAHDARTHACPAVKTPAPHYQHKAGCSAARDMPVGLWACTCNALKT